MSPKVDSTPVQNVRTNGVKIRKRLKYQLHNIFIIT